MAGASLLTLLDDISLLLDDVATMSKVAIKKTAGVLGDDLALNAQQVTGVNADRELPLVWAVSKGSFLNKFILVPAALAISAFAPWAVTPLLMLGGAFLCYEGFEKLAHRFLHSKAEDQQHHKELVKAVTDPTIDIVQFEKDKIKGAIRTDFILSAEIVAITLGTVANEPFWTQVAVLSGVALMITVGVYGLVAGIVKLDDGGLYLSKVAGTGSAARMQRSIGRAILLAAPYMMKSLSIIGTAAMFLVGGGILIHGIPGAEGMVHHIEELLHAVPAIGGVLGFIGPILLDGIVGILAGGIVLALVSLVSRIYRTMKVKST